MENKLDYAEEYNKCSKDPAYFIRKYCLIEHPIKGLIPFDLYRFQGRIVSEITTHRFNIIRKFRQAGITTIAAAYSLWTIMFKDNKNVMVVSIGERESSAFLERVWIMHQNLPDWLKPDVKVKNVHTLLLEDTRSRIKSQPAGAGRGEAVSLLIVDEAAFIDKIREFWKAIFPTIATGGDCLMISTVNGMSNLYYELYRDAEKGINGFNVIDIHYLEHPEYQSEEWAKGMKEFLGERGWLQEVLCAFLGTGDTFIDHNTLKKIQDNISKDFCIRYNKRMRVWKEPDPNRVYLLSADSSYGRERDNSAFHVFDLYNGEQVAEFYSNSTPLKTYSKIIVEVANLYNNASVIVERNALGILLIETLFSELEYDNMWSDEKGDFGILITPKSREAILAELEHYLRQGRIKINSERTINELLTFIIDDSQKVKADVGYNDDLVISLAIGVHALEDLGITYGVDIQTNTPDPETLTISRNNAYSERDRELIEYKKWLLQ